MWQGESLSASLSHMGPERGDAVRGQDIWQVVCPGHRKQRSGQAASSCHICVFLCSKDESAFMVDPLTAQGVAVVIVAYDIAPKGNGSGCCRSEGWWALGGSASLTQLMLSVQAPWTTW